MRRIEVREDTYKGRPIVRLTADSADVAAAAILDALDATEGLWVAQVTDGSATGVAHEGARQAISFALRRIMWDPPEEEPADGETPLPSVEQALRRAREERDHALAAVGPDAFVSSSNYDRWKHAMEGLEFASAGDGTRGIVAWTRYPYRDGLPREFLLDFAQVLGVAPRVDESGPRDKPVLRW